MSIKMRSVKVKVEEPKERQRGKVEFSFSNLAISSLLDGWSTLWMVFPVLYSSDTCIKHNVHIIYNC